MGILYDLMLGLSEVTIIVIMVLLFLICVISYRFYTVLETYVRAYGTRDAINYGVYSVKVEDISGKVVKEEKVKAWNKANAVERVAKRLEQVNELRFRVEKE